MRLWLLTLALLTAAACRSAPMEEALTPLYFPQTGHLVSPPFRVGFERLGGAACLGYPISKPFKQDGRLVQYFQYARLEWHPQNPPRYQIQPSLLGEALGRRQAPLTEVRLPRRAQKEHRYYPQSGHAVSYEFLVYFDQCGGVDRFGYPISEAFFDGRHLVQDFQRGRLLWVESGTHMGQIQQGWSGTLYAALRRIPAEALHPVPLPSGVIVAEISDQEPFLREVAIALSLWSPRAGAHRLLLITANDKGQPVSGLGGEIILHSGQGTVRLPLPPTDAAGISQTLIPAEAIVAGEILPLEIRANGLSLEAALVGGTHQAAGGEK